MHWRLVKEMPTIPLSQDQIDTFWRDGHLAIHDFIDQSQIDRITQTFHRLFLTRAGWKEGNFFDLAGSEDDGQLKLPQLLHPAKYAPELLRTIFWANAEAVAKDILGPSVQFYFDHALNKAPHPESATPWHQDQAFARAGSRIDNITIWLPLQDVDEENGCLTFIPGSHMTGIMPHRNYKDDKRIEGLEAIGVNLSNAVTVPMRKGSVSIHHSRTLHYAGPNLSSRPRKVYAVVFAVEREEPVVPVDYSWNVDKPTARQKRQLDFDKRLITRTQRSIKKAFRNTIYSIMGKPA